MTAYGLMIVVGVLAAGALAARRMERRGVGTRDDLSFVATRGVVGGIIGARLYHVATDWGSFSGHLERIPMIWRGGLGIPGGLLGGIIFGLYAARRRDVPLAEMLTIAAPAIPLAQSIGRWGNWWNQELFGKATTLPWALRISEDRLPDGYPFGTTFHPTFLYESLWNLALCLGLLWIERKVRLRPGRLFAVYLLGYFTGRFWIEGLRIDRAHIIGGLRLNQWVAVVVALSAAGFLLDDRFRRPVPAEPGEVDSTVDPVESSQDLALEPTQPPLE